MSCLFLASGLIGLVGGAYLFITAVKSLSAELAVSPLLLALLITPLATELPEMRFSRFLPVPDLN
jgi:cation:H+ antiporter